LSSSPGSARPRVRGYTDHEKEQACLKEVDREDAYSQGQIMPLLSEKEQLVNKGDCRQNPSRDVGDTGDVLLARHISSPKLRRGFNTTLQRGGKDRNNQTTISSELLKHSGTRYFPHTGLQYSA
jgi:hypothetical protein